VLIEIKSKVSMPQGVTIYQGDNNVDEIVISVDRYYGEYDIADFNAYLKIKYVDDSCNQIILKVEEKNQEKIVLKAKIDYNLTRIAGVLTCQPFFANDDNSLCFNASTFNLQVEPSIEAYETIEQEMLPGTLVTLQAELKLARQEFEESVANYDLGEFTYKNMNSTLNDIKSNSICYCRLINDNGQKESAFVITFIESQDTIKQTLIFVGEDGYFNKYCTRSCYIGVIEVWQDWTEDYLVTKNYVDSKIAELKSTILS